MNKTVIIGGVAAGAGCAARLRRLDENAMIILLERGEYISYANCGLPYYTSGVIRSEDSLLVTKTEVMRDRFQIDVRTKNEVVKIDCDKKLLSVIDHNSGKEYLESYDNLVIATGSSPIRPRIQGIASDRIMTLWTVPDALKIRSMVTDMEAQSALVVGGGFIGLETADNLHKAGLKVTIVEAMDQVMAPLDPEMAMLLEDNIKENGVRLILSDGVASFEDNGEKVITTLASGRKIKADFVILSIGVRPNSAIAKDAGILCNERGGIAVDEHLRTNDPNIYAAGDVIEVEDTVFGGKTMIPLAGPANKQARIVADNLAGIPSTYEGTQGSSVAQIFDLTAACTGANEKTLKKRGLEQGKDYEKLIISQNSHAGYYPGAFPMILKLLFSSDGSKIYGAQIVGREGVDKRIDTIGTALRLGAGIKDLKNLELAYAPPYSSAKDPVNMAGFAAENVVNKLAQFADWNEPDLKPDAVRLDVREDAERLAYAIPDSVNIPLGQLRGRIKELDPKQEYIVFCAVGVRAHSASRILRQNGFDKVKIYPAGVRMYRILHPESAAEIILDYEEAVDDNGEIMKEIENIKKVRLDCSGLQCPGPIMQVFNTIKNMKPGEMLEVTASDPGFAKDIAAWCRRTGNILVSNEKVGNEYVACVAKGLRGNDKDVPFSRDTSERKNGRENLVKETPNGKTIIVFDGDMDKVLAAFVIANGALAMGRPVTMFFTFWGLTALRKTPQPKLKKTMVEKMFGTMLPTGSKKLKLSHMNMGGMGTAMMRKIMKDKNIDSLEDMMKKAMENGLKIIACSMSMDVMGIRKEELIDGVEIGGVGSYLGDAEESNVNLFI